MTEKAIGPFTPDDPKTHPKDWIRVKNEGPGDPFFILPHGAKVNVTKTENDKDYFEILDFKEWKGKLASSSFATVGDTKVSRLIPPPAYAGPAKVVWDAATSKVTVTSADGSQSVTAIATSMPKVPNGTYGLWPMVPGKQFKNAASHIDKAAHALTWWIIDHDTDKGYCLHAGENSLGCITVTEHAKWESIYNILLLARSADRLYSGKITIKEHDLIA